MFRNLRVKLFSGYISGAGFIKGTELHALNVFPLDDMHISFKGSDAIWYHRADRSFHFMSQIPMLTYVQFKGNLYFERLKCREIVWSLIDQF